MTRALAVLGVFFCSYAANAMCLSSGMQICQKMGLTKVRAHIDPNPIYNSCEVEFLELATMREWKARVVSCPEMTAPEYVYINYACNDTGDWYPDQIEIWSPEECELHPIKNKKRVEELVKKITPGMTADEVLKLLFRRHLRRESKDAPVNWTFHSYPGVSISVPMKSPCSSNDPATQKPYDVMARCEYQYSKYRVAPGEIKIHHEYMDKKECEMWGGTAKKTSGAPIVCEFSGRPYQVMQGSGPVVALRNAWNIIASYLY